jgi:hypothetical protein
LRFIETLNGSGAAWTPSLFSRRYALVAAVYMMPVVGSGIPLIIESRDPVVLALLALMAVFAVALPVMSVRGNGLSVTRDFVLVGSRRKPSRQIARTDVAEVRYRGEYGEFLGRDGAVLLKAPGMLTRRQMAEIADYLHVRFTLGAAGSAPEVFVLRPDKVRARKYKLVIALSAALGLGMGGFDLANRFWAAGAYTMGVGLFVAVVLVVRFRSNALVVTRDAVYKGRRARGRHAVRSEITLIAHGPRLGLNGADGSPLLRVDASLFTVNQVAELAERLAVPVSPALRPPPR